MRNKIAKSIIQIRLFLSRKWNEIYESFCLVSVFSAWHFCPALWFQLDLIMKLKNVTRSPIWSFIHVAQCCHKLRARPESIALTLHSKRLKYMNLSFLESFVAFIQIRALMCDGHWWLLSNTNSINTKLTKDCKINPTECDTSNNPPKTNSSRNIFIGFEFDLFPFKLKFEYRVHGNRANNYTNTDHKRE